MMFQARTVSGPDFLDKVQFVSVGMPKAQEPSEVLPEELQIFLPLFPWGFQILFSQ